MILVWRGRGYLVIPIVFGVSLAANLVFNATRGEGYYTHHKWPLASSLILSAAICWSLDGYLWKKSEQANVGKHWTEKGIEAHELFFIPIRYWAVILLAIALVLLGREFLHS